VTVAEPRTAALPVVDGLELPDEVRRLLRPGEAVADAAGREVPLPRWFYAIESWETALHLELAPYFGLYELIPIDVREAPRLRRFPRYVPLALAHLAAHLSVLRQRLGTYVHVAANGGYRSPAHELAAGPSGEPSPHCWGTAANLYRIGDERLDSEETIGRYAAVVRETLPGAWCRPWGREPGATIDHLHVDLGRYVLEPR
jgi:hypothetical protein